MLTKEAFNALLKTLEEPPAYAYFILATTELNKIPVTVQSRCQSFPFRHIAEDDIIRRLQYIADQEHIAIDRDALRTIAHMSDGGMRDAISLLDQMQSLETITMEDVKSRTGITGQEYIEDIMNALEQKDRLALLHSIAKVENVGVPLDVFTRQLLRLVRNTLHTNIAEKQSTNSLLQLQKTLLGAIVDIRVSPVPGLVLEAALLSLCDDSGSAQAPKEKAPKPKEATIPAGKKADAPKESTLQDASITAPLLSLESLQKSWPDVIEKTTPASVKMSLKNGRVTTMNDKRITISFTSAFHRDRVKETQASRNIEEVLTAIFKTPLSIDCIIEDEPTTETTIPEQPENAFVNVADAAAEIF